MRLNQLSYLVAIERYGTISRAAEALYVSQPSISVAVRELEEELGYTLFDRSCKNTVTLTAAGLVFRDSFHKLRREFLETRAAAESLRDAPALELRAGLGAGWNLLELLEGFQRRAEQAHPRAALSFCSDSFRALRSKVHDGELDVALCTQTGVQDFQGIELEPVGELKVTVPDSYMGDVIGDLNKRRGRVMGMDPTGDGNQVISAEVPMAEMGSYAIDLRSMTQSRGSFTFHFVRYEDCPPAAQEKAIAEAKALQAAEER